MDCFISYTATDTRMAHLIKRRLEQQELSVFMAELSIPVSTKWTREITNALNNSSWVIFLASRKACESPYVQQEVGAAIINGKTLVPVIWDIEPSELPGWSKDFQAIDLRKLYHLDDTIREIATRIRADKLKGAIITGATLAVIVYLAVQNNSN